MEIIDYSKYYSSSKNNNNHAPFFPKNIICVIAGSTGCGKTNLLINLLLRDGILDYGDVHIYSPTLHQGSYQYLKQCYQDKENKIKAVYKLPIKIASFYDTDEEIIDPGQLNPNISHIMIFDDVMLKDQTKIKDYFCRGRHNNVNMFYLCQSLYKITKHCIRENANFFILFRQDEKTLKYFHETHITGDMDFKEFKEFCDNAWSKKHGFVAINLWEDPYCGRYLKNNFEIYVPKKYI